ncbi:MAG: putative DNA modification/repair radical SAM protein [Proteobacteria bacterium]|nr:putative DNA modification/repair radical SAM protein [Pseudomonadota bacterium]
MNLIDKLAVLADAAKYDASCASSGAAGRRSSAQAGVGSTTGMGICHSYAPDGRCISLLKLLLTNFCLYDCQYCVNRRSSDVPRARFAIDEVVRLTLDFYRRNYIEGLFLSSGIIRSPDYTMEQVVAVARSLREDHDFRGYIHLKTIPAADERLIALAGRYADRLSVNLELPSDASLSALAPEKSSHAAKQTMARIHVARRQDRERRRDARGALARKDVAPVFASAGQSTQLVVGADRSTDAAFLTTASGLYAAYDLKRVYYSAFSPIPSPSPRLLPDAPPLVREHRLYQADWLMRFYGYDAAEIVATLPEGNLDLDVDPKLGWALAHRAFFPVDVNAAPREALLRIPGIGVRNVKRIVATRRRRRLRYADLATMRCDLTKARAFVVTADWRPPHADVATPTLRKALVPARQASLW